MAAPGNHLILGWPKKSQPIVLSDENRLEHIKIFGQTGTGKSRYLQGLVRQDIRQWPKHRCGMLVIDPHGEMFDGLMAWIAANRLTSLPIVPIDFRRGDRFISYNILRQRPTAPSVIIDAVVKSMAYVWGQEGTDETPLFERWATNTLYRLYWEKKTLADAAHMFTPEGLVRVETIDDPMIRQDWMWARRNRKDFETATSSSINRFRRFLLNPMLRAMFGQSEVSLDLGRALDEGQIVLVSLARNGGRVSRENADLFATLLLADLQVSADERGKGEKVKPFYIFLDEFWRFLSPTMAENLAESRGFGLGMTLATQFPRQILNGGRYGPRIFDEVVGNTRTTVCFRLRSRPNLEVMADELFLNTFDPDKVKYQHYSIKVVGHELKYLPTFGTSTSSSIGGGRQISRTNGTSRFLNNNWSHSDIASRSMTHSHSETVGESDGYGEYSGESGDGDDSDRGDSSHSEGESHNHSTSHSETNGFSETESRGTADSVGGGETAGTSESDTDGQSSNWTSGTSFNLSMGPTLFSVFSREPEQPLFRPIDEQKFLAMQSIAQLRKRECFILAGDMKAPAFVRTPVIDRPDISQVCTELSTGWYQIECGLALPLDQALARLGERDQEFYSFRVLEADDQVDQPRRRLVAASVQLEDRSEPLS